MDVPYLAVFGVLAGLTWALVRFCARLFPGDRS